MGSGKPRGIRAGRKLATKRRLQKYLPTKLGGTTKSIIQGFYVPDIRTHLWVHVLPKDWSLKK